MLDSILFVHPVPKAFLESHTIWHNGDAGFVCAICLCVADDWIENEKCVCCAEYLRVCNKWLKYSQIVSPIVTNDRNVMCSMNVFRIKSYAYIYMVEWWRWLCVWCECALALFTPLLSVWCASGSHHHIIVNDTMIYRSSRKCHVMCVFHLSWFYWKPPKIWFLFCCCCFCCHLCVRQKINSFNWNRLLALGHIVVSVYVLCVCVCVREEFNWINKYKRYAQSARPISIPTDGCSLPLACCFLLFLRILVASTCCTKLPCMAEWVCLPDAITTYEIFR